MVTASVDFVLPRAFAGHCGIDLRRLNVVNRPMVGQYLRYVSPDDRLIGKADATR